MTGNVQNGMHSSIPNLDSHSTLPSYGSRALGRATTGSLAWWLRLIGFTAVLYIAARIGILAAIPPGLASPIWPVSGLALVIMLLCGRNLWPAIFLGSVLVNLPTLLDKAEVPAANAWMVAALIASGSSFQAFVGARCIKEWVGTIRPFRQAREVFAFVGISLLFCLVAASVAVTALYSGGFIPAEVAQETFWTWWLGDLVGVVVVAPLFLTFNLNTWRMLEVAKLIELAVLLFLLGVAAFLVFHPSSGLSNYPILHIFIVFILWAAFRLDYSAVMLCVGFLTCAAVWGYGQLSGPFMGNSVTLNQSLILLQIFLAMMAIMGLAITSELNARKELEGELSRFKFISDNSTESHFLVNEERHITYANRIAVEKSGYSAQELLGMNLSQVYADLSADTLSSLYEDAREGRPVRPFEARQSRRDGNSFPVELSVQGYSFSGKFYLLSIARDITERKLAEVNKDLLLRELSHRVKNTLMNIQSIANQTRRGSETIDDFMRLFEGRVRTLGHVHALLTNSNWQGADIVEVSKHILEPFGSADTEQILMEGPSVILSSAQALTVSLILHELATNACKYGALSSPHGRIELSWIKVGMSPYAQLHLTWMESGGPKVAAPQRKGFGTTLMERGPRHELGGEAKLVFQENGLYYELKFSLVSSDSEVISYV